MLFHVTRQFVDTGEDGIRRSLAVFSKWQPPAGAEFKGFYGFADGGGGIALIEADSAATIARTRLAAAAIPAVASRPSWATVRALTRARRGGVRLLTDSSVRAC